MSHLLAIPQELMNDWMTVVGIAVSDYVIDVASNFLPRFGNAEVYLIDGVKKTASMVIYSKKGNFM